MKYNSPISILFALFAACPNGHGAAIIEMGLSTFGHYAETYKPAGAFILCPSADYYILSDGSSWLSGAGWHPYAKSTLTDVTVVDSVVFYTFSPLVDGVIFQNKDYDGGEHSAQGILGFDEPFTIHAQIGSTMAYFSGLVTIVSNEPTWYGYPRFNDYSATTGDSVLLELAYTNTIGWTPLTFESSFNYNVYGAVKFSSIPEPHAYGIILGFAAAFVILSGRKTIRGA